MWETVSWPSDSLQSQVSKFSEWDFYASGAPTTMQLADAFNVIQPEESVIAELVC